jgi:RHS repeat-associated protein
VFQHSTQLLALQQRHGDELNSQLLATDQQRSVLHTLDEAQHLPTVYTPYGHRRAESGLSSLLGFNGERRDPVTGHYLLGNGHRAFNPVLMRFNSPDRLSPFGRGGLNPYAYCLGDPVNFSDPTGQFVFAAIARLITSIGTLFNSAVTLKPGIPFQVASDALANGAIYQLPLKHIVGAGSSVIAGGMGVTGAVLGVMSASVTVVNPASVVLAPLAYGSLGTTSVAVAGRIGSYWAALDPTVLPALKNLAGGSPSVVAPAVRRLSRSLSIDMDFFAPTAPPLTPGTYAPTAPPQTPGAVPSLPSGRRGIKRSYGGERHKLVARRSAEVRQT